MNKNNDVTAYAEAISSGKKIVVKKNEKQVDSSDSPYFMALDNDSMQKEGKMVDSNEDNE